MANQDFNLIGAIKVRAAEENDAMTLHAYCFPEKTIEQVTEELKPIWQPKAAPIDSSPKPADTRSDKSLSRKMPAIRKSPRSEVSQSQAPFDS